MHEGKKIANSLLNLPASTRAWVIKHVSPETWARWCRQNSVALQPYRTLRDKVEAYAAGESLSELAQYEAQHQP